MTVTLTLTVCTVLKNLVMNDVIDLLSVFNAMLTLFNVYKNCKMILIFTVVWTPRVTRILFVGCWLKKFVHHRYVASSLFITLHHWKLSNVHSSPTVLHCTLSLAVKCIVIGPVCGHVCNRRVGGVCLCVCLCSQTTFLRFGVRTNFLCQVMDKHASN